MKVWLIGAKGQLGKELSDALKFSNIFFVSTEKEEVDITSKDAVLGFCKNFTHIINASAYTDVEGADLFPEKAFEVNVQGVANLIEAANRISGKLIHFSTDYVFDGEKKEPYVEEDVCLPLNVYGRTKRDGEELILKRAKSYLLIRTSWLIGKGKNFVKTILRKLETQGKLSVVCNQRGKLTFAKDLAKATLELLEKEGIFHFSNQGITSWYEIALEVKKLNGSSKEVIPVEDYPSRAKRPLYSVLDTKKVEKFLSFKIRDWKLALEEYLHDET